MSDKPATNQPEKLPAKAGEPTTEGKTALEKALAAHAESETTRRLFASSLPLGVHPPLESKPAAPKPESSSWSFSSLTASVENSVGGLFKSAEKSPPPPEKSLPPVQLVADKHAAPSLPENASVVERVASTFTSFASVKKTVGDGLDQFNHMTTTQKTLAVGGAVVGLGAALVPELKGFKAFKGLAEETSAAERGMAALHGAEEAKIGALQRALKEEKSLTEAGNLTHGTSPELKFATTEVKSNPFAAAQPEAPAARFVASTPEAPAAKFVAPKPDTLAGLDLAKADASVPRFVASTPKPQPFVHAGAPEVHVVAPVERFVAKPTEARAAAPHVENKAVVTPVPAHVDAADAHVPQEPTLPKPSKRVDEPSEPKITPVQPREAAKPLPTHVQSTEAHTPVSVSHGATEVARPAVAPAKPVEFTEAARPAVAPAKPVEFT
ncbi:MAG: hypothetical protein P4L53_24015, partial [Candidatus Obscuribacterales bacterium]|nr:hypothetical protein [Candidatus Obscuribacterales bacterium]